jgi:hypothetical protein
MKHKCIDCDNADAIRTAHFDAVIGCLLSRTKEQVSNDYNETVTYKKIKAINPMGLKRNRAGHCQYFKQRPSALKLFWRWISNFKGA